eukprot:2751454-Prymnesium_polylepis.1
MSTQADPFIEEDKFDLDDVELTALQALQLEPSERTLEHVEIISTWARSQACVQKLLKMENASGHHVSLKHLTDTMGVV